jgi:phage terminase large subunit-like protein
VWYECNPSLGVSIDIDSVRLEALAAKNSPSVEQTFRWLRLNQWVSLKRTGWLPITLWDQTESDWTPQDLFGKRCYVGIDLSSKIDLTAISPVFPPQEGFADWRFFVDAWVPEENMLERVRRDHVQYDQWHRDGYLHVTPGSVVDYSILKDHLETLERQYRVEYYCGDPWHLGFLRQLMSRDVADRFIDIIQTMAGMSTGMGELERLFRAGGISHPHNPLGRWSFGNVVPATDGNENKKPMKNRSIDRIDPTVATINGMAGAIKLEQKQSVYEQRGMRIL